MVKNVKDILLDDFWIMPATPEYIEQGVPYITSKNIKNGKIDFSKANYISQDAYETISKNRPILVGDILISMIGTLGETAEVTVEDGNFYGQNMFLIRLNETEVNKRYFLNYFKSDFVKRSLASKQNQSTQKYLKANHIEDLQIPVLSLKEQQSIAETLDTIERIIINRKEELLKLDELIKARFVELFGDMTVNPNGWEVVPLGKVCDVRDGTHDSPKYFTEGYPLVTSKNVTSGKIDFSDCNLICEEDYKKINERSKVDFGDILMPMIGTVGKPVIVDMDAEFAIKNVALIKFYKGSQVTNIFVKALLQSDYFDRAVISKIRGGTQKFIALGDIRKLEICLPPMFVQEEFAIFVSQTDKSKIVWLKAPNIINYTHEKLAPYMYKTYRRNAKWQILNF